MSALARAAADAASSPAQLRALALEALRFGREEMGRARSGRERPVEVCVSAGPDGLVVALPVDVALRVDPAKANEREWQLTAASVGALADISDLPAPARPEQLVLRAGDLDGFLTLHLPGADIDLAALAFEDRLGGIDRLRAQAVVLPAEALPAVDLRTPVNTALRGAEADARLGGDADLIEALLGAAADASRPHEDPDPGRRIARRILQRLHGMGKWGGYHTEFAHLPRGFAGNDRALAVEVGEALLESGLLAEKPSVGQRHVFLNPRRSADIHRMIETGDTPPGLTLPAAQ
jgi:hypothetical protein